MFWGESFLEMNEAQHFGAQHLNAERAFDLRSKSAMVMSKIDRHIEIMCIVQHCDSCLIHSSQRHLLLSVTIIIIMVLQLLSQTSTPTTVLMIANGIITVFN